MLSVAPMIGWTDKNFRFLVRQITRQTLLYTEMVMDSAVTHNTDRLVDFIGYDRDTEPPLALQLGGSDPETLGEAVAIAEHFGNFSEINLNAGCPSNKAKRGGFGAELMLDSEEMRRIVYEMNRRSSSTKITVKSRIGTNRLQGWDHLVNFVAACKAGGTSEMIIHARICVLNGLTPAQNRTVPPLDYDVVHRLVKEFPDMSFTLNGGIKSFEEADLHLGRTGKGFGLGCDSAYDAAVHGVMIGRAAYGNPWMLANADSHYFGKRDLTFSRWEVMEKYFEYCDHEQESSSFRASAPNLCKPLHNFFHGSPANKMYKVKLDKLIKERPTDTVRGLVTEAVSDTIPDSFLHERPALCK